MYEFRRERHRRIWRALEAFDADFLTRARCYFGGGTRIAIALGEYRESADIDFLCADRSPWQITTQCEHLRTPLHIVAGQFTN